MARFPPPGRRPSLGAHHQQRNGTPMSRKPLPSLFLRRPPPLRPSPRHHRTDTPPSHTPPPPRHNTRHHRPRHRSRRPFPFPHIFRPRKPKVANIPPPTLRPALLRLRPPGRELRPRTSSLPRIPDGNHHRIHTDVSVRCF